MLSKWDLRGGRLWTLLAGGQRWTLFREALKQKFCVISMVKHVVLQLTSILTLLAGGGGQGSGRPSKKVPSKKGG